MIISFDFWGTIAKSNPAFKTNQAKLIPNISESDWRDEISKLKVEANATALQLGINAKLPSRANFYPIQDGKVKSSVMTKSLDLFKEYPPRSIGNTVRAIKSVMHLKSTYPELKLGIVSNTLSIPGSEIKNYLFNTLGLRFDFFNFSDEMNISKPNPRMFDTKFGKVDLHIGDEPNFDNCREDVMFMDVDIVDEIGLLACISHNPKIVESEVSELEFSYSFKKFSSIESITFNPSDYSKLKYGSNKVAKNFGKLMTKGMLRSKVFKKFLDESEGMGILVGSAPYKFLPVAATQLQKEVVQVMSLDTSITTPVLPLKIYRGHSYNANYGAMTAEKRSQALSSDSFHIDKDFIKGKALILVDDVRITGSHETRMRELLKSINHVGPVLYLYFANYTGSGDPSIENYLNYKFLHLGLQSIESIISNGDFIFNTRVTKYILESDPLDFKRFIINQSDEFVRELLVGAKNNGYYEIDEFKANLDFAKELTLF